MSLLVLAISLVFGVVVFIKLIGPDAWLIKGLRGDQFGAVVALCSILLCGMLIFFLLHLSLSLLEELPIRASAAAEVDSAAEYTQSLPSWDIIVCLLSFCLPILTGYLLSLIYRGVYGAVRRLALR